MKAAVIYEAGGPEVLKLETRNIPRASTGHVLINVKAFGLNRSEYFTRYPDADTETISVAFWLVRCYKFTLPYKIYIKTKVRLLVFYIVFSFQSR